MWNLLWPMVLVVLSNCVYNICTKSTPEGANAFGSLMVTYLTAAALSAILFLFSCLHKNAVAELLKINWSSLVLGVSIVGLEFGYIYLYRAGWKLSVGSLVANISLACVLLLIGILLYKESVSLRQAAGMLICVVGLVLISKP